ncbi:hypothetical protein [Sphingomonas baiyangensis]|uniref:Uncharacterized protein n=1 Tax=Sphingomonas baiyangensis TaxID=2572576 RepID=A0A4U1L201_9SPHN|nr:hypothetical protein [Sphingomonas baiyangensis]TKD50514.1 hypothetical protein FBR43_06850 [Sphingomonas baiyangensis]
MKTILALFVALVAIVLALGLREWTRDRNHRQRRKRRQVQRRAHQKAWEWVMGSRRHRRLPYLPKDDANAGEERSRLRR